MKTLATLHTEQKMNFDEKLLNPAQESYRTAVNDQSAPYRHQVENLLEARSLSTVNFLSHIDLMIEIVESKKKEYVEFGKTMKYVLPIKHIGYNEALSDLSTLLSAQRKLIEEQ